MNSQWIENICLVKFDIEIGQIVEWTQPVKSLNEVDEKNISMLAFPDSNSFAQNEGHLKYVFRMRRSAGKNKFSLGFTLFMQRKDEDNPRGYTQKSVVILTNLPLVSFYYSLLDNIYINIKQGCMKAQLQYAFEQISNWEKPSPNRLFNLSLFNSKIAVEVPHYLKMQKADSEQNIELQEIMYDLTLSNMIQFDDMRDVGQFQETNLYTALPHAMLVHLPKLWELVLTNQPFMVMADSPSQGSEAILGIISLMSPMRFTGDYRPYFTIYDKEFQQINSELENSFARNIIIGVTNPFFLKAYNKFPVIVRCDQSNQRLQIQPNREFCLNDDKETLRMLIPIKNEETKAINNSLIKKVYRNMSLEFIGMFEMYFASQQNQVKKFDEKEFIEFLKTCKVSFQGLFQNKEKFLKLYQNFIRSSNFVTYLNERKSVYIAKSII